MRGLVPGISCSQIRRTLIKHVNGRDKPGHGELGVLFQCGGFLDQNTSGGRPAPPFPVDSRPSRSYTEAP